MNQKQTQELEELRKEKQIRLCNELSDSLKLTGENLGRTKDKILNLLSIQESRIESFREHFKEWLKNDNKNKIMGFK